MTSNSDRDRDDNGNDNDRDERNDKRESLHAMARDIREIRRLLDGADDPSRGLIVRVDRVEQNARSNSKLMWCVIGAVVIVAVDRFTGHNVPVTVSVPQTQNAPAK